jgi:transposase
MAHGLIRDSFVPDAPTQQLRDLLRTRKQFVRERSRHVQRLQKTLEDANIKLDSVISDIIGLSGRALIEALIAGEIDPDALAFLAHRRIKAPPAVLREALHGRVTDHHRFLLQLHLHHVKALDIADGAIDR